MVSVTAASIVGTGPELRAIALPVKVAVAIVLLNDDDSYLFPDFSARCSCRLASLTSAFPLTMLIGLRPSRSGFIKCLTQMHFGLPPC